MSDDFQTQDDGIGDSNWIDVDNWEPNVIQELLET
jgi:hypothetical protein